MLTGLVCAVALLAPARGSPAGPIRILDNSSYKVYQRDRALGSETFSYEVQGDSLRIYSHVVQTLEGPNGEVSIDKQMAMILGAADYDLQFYQSTLRAGGRDLTRGLVMSDTAFTAYRESGGRGQGDRLVRPPGRLFVVDPQLFVLFDVMCRNLSGKTFERRAVPVIVLGDRDSVLDVTVTDLGQETIQWGSKPVSARKLSIDDIVVWIGPQGYMLRLEQPGLGLRVVRQAPAIRPAKKRPPPGS